MGVRDLQSLAVVITVIAVLYICKLTEVKQPIAVATALLYICWLTEVKYIGKESEWVC